jgi:hypothetical protein
MPVNLFGPDDTSVPNSTMTLPEIVTQHSTPADIEDLEQREQPAEDRDIPSLIAQAILYAKVTYRYDLTLFYSTAELFNLKI